MSVARGLPQTVEDSPNVDTPYVAKEADPSWVKMILNFEQLVLLVRVVMDMRISLMLSALFTLPDQTEDESTHTLFKLQAYLGLKITNMSRVSGSRTTH